MSNYTIEEALIAARLLRPYYARAINALTPVESTAVPTMGVDAHWRLYYNPEFLARLELQHAALVIAAHEVEHLLRDHGGRLRDVQAPAAVKNVAGDLEINDDLQNNETFGPVQGVTPEGFAYPPHLLAEAYLTMLLDDPNVQLVGTCSGGSGAGTPEDWEQDGAGRPGIEPHEAEPLRDAVAMDVANYAATNGRGSVPSGALIWAEARVSLRSPPFDWRRALVAQVASLTGGSMKPTLTRTKISRRQRPNMPIRPGIQRFRPKLVMVVDTSGSMPQSTVQAVFDVARRCGEITIVQCDAEVTAITRRFPTEWRGGGGTDLRPAIEKAETLGDLMVVVTDCDTPWPAVAPTVPTVVVAVAGSVAPSWARVLHLPAGV